MAQSPSPMDSTPLTSTRLRFLIGLAVGLVAGLLYGWLLNPVEFVETGPDALREDYRTDYVLMVAEAYQADQDLARARRRLGALGPDPSLRMVEQALAYAERRQFAGPPIATLEELAAALERRGSTPEIGGP